MKRVLVLLSMLALAVTHALAAGSTPQTITYPALALHGTADADFSVGATTTSGLALTYASSNPMVATVNASTGLVHIVGPGETSISVAQAGNATYAAAFAVRVLQVREAGPVLRWGYRYGTTPYNDGAEGVVMTAGGSSHILALKSDGTVLAWGRNSEYQLGNGGTGSGSTLAVISGLSNVISVAASANYSMALTQSGQVYCWGTTGAYNSASTPTLVSGVSDVVAISAGRGKAFALKSDGTVFNMIHYTGFNSSPTPIEESYGVALSRVVSIAAGTSFGLALKNDGTLVSWGYGGEGQLGQGRYMTSSTYATAISSLSGIVSVTTGANHAMALKSDGTVYAWGEGSLGQIGDLYGSDRFEPVQISLTGAVAVAAGSGHSMALINDGTVYAWGLNNAGQLGIGNTTDKWSPVAISNLAGVHTIAASDSQSFAIVPLPIIKSISHAWGPVSGGRVMTIQGNNFDLATGVRFGTVSATTWKIDSPTQISVTAPAHAEGAVDITLSSAVGTSLVVPAGRFTYSVPKTPVVTSVSPATGLVIGGTTVTIQGQNLDDVTQVLFGAKSSAKITQVSSTQITAVAPANSEGTVDIRVSTLYGGQSAVVAADKFSYLKQTQVITFPRIASHAVGDADFACGATSNSGLALTYQSSNPGVATVDASTGVVHILRNGETTIIASQGGGQNYDPALSIQVLRVQSSGFVAAWGGNVYGQLGNNSNMSSEIPVEASELGEVVSIVGGNSHTLALTKAGKVFAWGDNFNGQLGDGSRDENLIPREVAGLSGIVAITAGTSTSFALKSDGTVYWWGMDIRDSMQQQLTPVQIASLSGIVAISAGDLHLLALQNNGTVVAWGYNDCGQLGDGTNTKRQIPVLVEGLVGAVSIASGNYYSLALRMDGRVESWGLNVYGMLGDGTDTDHNSPAQIMNLSDVVALETGHGTSYATKRDGSVMAWGANEHGQLGDGTQENRLSPVVVNGLGNVVQVSADFLSMAMQDDGKLLQWGVIDGADSENNSVTMPPEPLQGMMGCKSIYVAYKSSYCILGNPTISKITPDAGSKLGGNQVTIQGDQLVGDVQVRFGGVLASQVTVDTTGTLTAIAPAGTVGVAAVTVTTRSGVSAGINYRYRDIQTIAMPALARHRVGDEDFPVSATASSGLALTYRSSNPNVASIDPVTGMIHIVRSGETTIEVSQAGAANYEPVERYQVLRVRSTSQAWGWGFNEYGVLGEETTDSDVTAPLMLSQFPDLVKMDGGYHSLALSANGRVYACGFNRYGQLGDGSSTTTKTPALVSGLSSIVDVAAGVNTSYAMDEDGNVYGWGLNNAYQLGIGTTDNHSEPVKIDGLGAIALAAGDFHTLALRGDGRVFTWGSGVSKPMLVDSLENVVAIATGSNFSVALRSDGRVLTWGTNDEGQMGNGSYENNTTPQVVAGLTDVVAIAAGGLHVVALKKDGTLVAWGYNAYGQLGNGANKNQTTPVNVVDLSDVVAIEAGEYFTLALRSDGTVWAWGTNSNRQLGNENPDSHSLPTLVAGLLGVEAIATGVNYSIALVPKPVILSKDLASDVYTGGSLMTLTGEHFSADAEVGFGGILASSVKVLSDYQIEVTVPASVSIGFVDITVETLFGGRSEVNNASLFRYTKKPQVIAFNALPNVYYGVAQKVSASTVTGLPIEYYSTTRDVCMVSLAGDVTTVSAGLCEVEATQAGTALIAEASASGSFQVLPAPLTITAPSLTYKLGDALPTTFDFTISGYVNGEDASVLKDLGASFSCGECKTAGTFDIVPSASSANYEIKFVNGVLTLNAPTSIVNRQLPRLNLRNAPKFDLLGRMRL